MSERVELRVTMELLSDAIFGSGYSIPGGEDVAVVRDEAGYPFLPGTAVKGLLRESLENWLVWTGGSGADLDEILGMSDWQGADGGRRLTLTPLSLEDPRPAAEDCFGFRVFTALEDGVVKTGTLRNAACVLKGLRFQGTMTCAAADVPLLQRALAGIKWVGAQRSRGFGRVAVRGEQAARQAVPTPIGAAHCIRYRLRTETPVLITDLSRSGGNSYETHGYIPGSAIRGMVISTLAARDPAWFGENRAALLSERTRFLDAMPKPGELEVLPSIKGFYEDKAETAFQSVVTDPDLKPGWKRAGLGTFCGLKDGRIHYWSAKTGGVTRIQRGAAEGEETKPFQTRYLSAGQVLEGYVMLEDANLAPKVAEAFSSAVWLGADRYEGYGKCAVIALEVAEQPGWTAAYGYRTQSEIGRTLYLLAVSPLTMLDGVGDPCGLELDELAEALGVGQVKLERCATSLTEYSGYNRTWRCREPALPMYDRGSIFKLTCDRPPALERIQTLQRTGLGVRAAEGFGQVLFLRPDLFEGLAGKRKPGEGAAGSETAKAKARRARYQWIMENSGLLRRDGLSESQLGSIQALCEKAMANGGNLSGLESFLRKKQNDQGVRQASRFPTVAGLIREVTGQPLSATINAECEDSMEARLRLLCQLFNYSRREKEAD